MIDEVVDTIGIQLYQYLHPKDLFYLSICNHKLYNDIVHKKLAEICISHLPLQLGKGTNYLGTFKEGASSGSKEELLEFVLDKTEAADIVIKGTSTFEESRHKTRENIIDNSDTSGRFYPRGNPTYIIPIIIECKYEWSTENSVASSWVDHILNRSTFRGDKKKYVPFRKDKKTYAIIKSWLDFLFAIQNSNRYENMISFGMWSWKCNHPKLKGQGIAGMGVMMNIQHQNGNGEEGNNDKIVEISFTRSY